MNINGQIRLLRTRHFILSIFLCYCFNVWAEEREVPDDSYARYEILGPYLLDVGDIYSNVDSVSSSFWLKSTGNVPLIIVSSSTSCPCTVASFDQDIVFPGDSVEIKITYFIKSHIGPFLQSALLKTNTLPHDYVWFYIKGNILKPSERECPIRE